MDGITASIILIVLVFAATAAALLRENRREYSGGGEVVTTIASEDYTLEWASDGVYTSTQSWEAYSDTTTIFTGGT